MIEELRRTTLNLKLILHTEKRTQVTRVADAYSYVIAGEFERAERALLGFVKFKTIHPINRSRAYSALSKIAALQCFEKFERKRFTTQFQNEENGNQP
jgi:hypothetical protein